MLGFEKSLPLFPRKQGLFLWERANNQGEPGDINSEKNSVEELSLSTKSESQSDFGKQSEARPSHTADSQPPLVLTLEQKTPMARWIIVAVLGLLGFGILTYWITRITRK